MTADEIAWALGPRARARVVGVSALADDLRYSAIAGRWPRRVARVSGRVEEILAVAPDHVVVSDYTEVETLAALAAAGVTTTSLGASNGLSDFVRQIGTVGDVLSEPTVASSLIAAAQARRDALSARRPLAASGAATREVLAFVGDLCPAARTTFDDACAIAGVDNVAAEGGDEGWISLGAERLIARDPMWIAIGCDADCAAATMAFASRPGHDVLRACQRSHAGILTVHPRVLASAGIELLALAERLQSVILGQPLLPAWKWGADP